MRHYQVISSVFRLIPVYSRSPCSFQYFFFSKMIALLSGCSIYRVTVPLEINGETMEFDFHLRVSGGLNWHPYLDEECKARLSASFSNLDPLVYQRFLLPIMEVSVIPIRSCIRCCYIWILALFRLSSRQVPTNIVGSVSAWEFRCPTLGVFICSLWTYLESAR